MSFHCSFYVWLHKTVVNFFFDLSSLNLFTRYIFPKHFLQVSPSPVRRLHGFPKGIRLSFPQLKPPCWGEAPSTVVLMDSVHVSTFSKKRGVYKLACKCHPVWLPFICPSSLLTGDLWLNIFFLVSHPEHLLRQIFPCSDSHSTLPEVTRSFAPLSSLSNLNLPESQDLHLVQNPHFSEQYLSSQSPDIVQGT